VDFCLRAIQEGGPHAFIGATVFAATTCKSFGDQLPTQRATSRGLAWVLPPQTSLPRLTAPCRGARDKAKDVEELDLQPLDLASDADDQSGRRRKRSSLVALVQR
jgi:hypothetical protein